MILIKAIIFYKFTFYFYFFLQLFLKSFIHKKFESRYYNKWVDLKLFTILLQLSNPLNFEKYW